MVSVEVVNPTKQHLAAYSYLHVLCCIYFMSTYFRPYYYISSSMKLTFSLKVSI